jgi:hypothetical protein
LVGPAAGIASMPVPVVEVWIVWMGMRERFMPMEV